MELLIDKKLNKMKKLILIITLLIFQEICFGQNLFFIGTESYPCTEKFMLKSKSPFHELDLDILIAKKNNKALFVVSTNTHSFDIRIKGKLLIYLNDGTVITCIDRNKFDIVDEIATTIYYLTDYELKKMENSNINTIRYSLKCINNCISSTLEGNYTVSNKSSKFGNSIINKKIDVPILIKKLFE